MAETRPISWKKNLFFVWFSQILALAGFAGIMPFIPIFIREKFHVTDERELGLWISVFTFASMLSFCFATPVWGMLADKYGRKLMLLRSYFAAGLLFPLMYFAPNIACLIAIRLFCSLFSGTVTAAQILVVTVTPQEHHGFALGMLSSAMWTGNMIGFLIGAMVVNWFGFLGGFLICGGAYLFGGILTFFFVHENFVPPQKEKVKTKKFSALRDIPLPVAGILLLFLCMGLARRFDDPYVAILVSLIGGNEKAVFHTGLISAAAAAGGFFSAILTGKLCDRFSPAKIAVPSILLASVTMIFQCTASSLLILGGARFFHFTAAGGMEPAFQVLLAKITPENKRGTFFGLASSARTIGILLAAALSGAVIGLFGVRAVFFCSSVLFLSLLPLLYFIIRILKKQATQS